MSASVTFSRIGRNHGVEDLPIAPEATADEVAEAVYRYARRFLVSRDIEVIVDGDLVFVVAGWRCAGEGRVIREAEAVSA